MNTLRLVVEEGERKEQLLFKLRRMVNAGYTGRDQEKVKKHIKELKNEGIAAPESTPTVYEVISKSIYFGSEIEVIGDKTSGEAEFVLLCTGKDIYVGVGSDHTDRELESITIIKSKQICPNIMSNYVWNLKYVRKNWDEIMLRSWIKNAKDEKVLYQEASLATVMTPEDLMEFVKNKLDDKDLTGVVIYSGTVSIIPDKIIYGNYFEVELYNPKTDKRLSCGYKIKVLNYLRR